MLRRFKADLHIHTCLSPCGDLSMSPQKITENVLRQQISIIAICDHNSAENVQPVMSAAQGKHVVVLPGMEVCSQEEIHVLAIFDKLEAALELQELVYAHLPGKNHPEVFGLQVVANERDEVVGFQDRLLIGATKLTIERVVNEIHRLGGLAVASHVDREAYSVIGQLGFVPESVRFDALELSVNISDEQARTRFSGYQRLPLIRNSDAHFIQDIGANASEYWLEGASFQELAKAMRKEEGRKVWDKSEARDA